MKPQQSFRTVDSRHPCICHLCFFVVTQFMSLILLCSSAWKGVLKGLGSSLSSLAIWLKANWSGNLCNSAQCKIIGQQFPRHLGLLLPQVGDHFNCSTARSSCNIYVVCWLSTDFHRKRICLESMLAIRQIKNRFLIAFSLRNACN